MSSRHPGMISWLVVLTSKNDNPSSFPSEVLHVCWQASPPPPQKKGGSPYQNYCHFSTSYFFFYYYYYYIFFFLGGGGFVKNSRQCCSPCEKKKSAPSTPRGLVSIISLSCGRQKGPSMMTRYARSYSLQKGPSLEDSVE